MESINKWAAAIAVCSVIVCITELLIADDKNRKIIRAVLGCFLLAAAIQPVITFSSGLKDLLPAHEYSLDADSAELTQMQHDMTDSPLEAEAERILTEKSLHFISADITVSYDTSGAASSLSCNISISEKDREHISEIKSAIKESFGIEPEIIIISEG